MLFGLSLYRLCNRTHADTYLPLMKCIIIVIIFIICMNICMYSVYVRKAAKLSRIHETIFKSFQAVTRKGCKK